MKKILIASLCWIALGAGVASARHGLAPVVLDAGGLHFVAPNAGGTARVNVTDSATGKSKWSVIVFRSPVTDPRLEEDARWIFIVKLEIDHRDLIVTDERDRRFAVDLESHAVRALPK